MQNLFTINELEGKTIGGSFIESVLLIEDLYVSLYFKN